MVLSPSKSRNVVQHSFNVWYMCAQCVSVAACSAFIEKDELVGIDSGSLPTLESSVLTTNPLMDKNYAKNEEKEINHS